ADGWRFAMNRMGFVVSFTIFLASGVLVVLMGYRVIASWHDARGGISRVGSQADPDPAYLKMPADGATDWMTGFTLTERSGREMQWKDLDGQVRVTSFFFSSCPANCLQENY